MVNFGAVGWDVPVDARTWARWVDARIEGYALERKRELGIAGSTVDVVGIKAEQRVADELGVTTRTLYRFRRQLDGNNAKAVFYSLSRVTEMLDHAGVGVWEVFPPDTLRRTPSGRKKPSNAGVPITVPEEIVCEAHRLHINEGQSIRMLARKFFDECDSTSVLALANTLHTTWRERGWETLTRAQAMALSNRRRHEHLPFCEHVYAAGARKGQRCTRRTSMGRCWHHRPENLIPNIARLRALDTPEQEAA